MGSVDELCGDLSGDDISDPDFLEFSGVDVVVGVVDDGSDEHVFDAVDDEGDELVLGSSGRVTGFFPRFL